MSVLLIEMEVNYYLHKGLHCKLSIPHSLQDKALLQIAPVDCYKFLIFPGHHHHM